MAVLFLDSGLGGLSYCRRFLLRNPHSKAVYLADRADFPYGSKTKEALTRLLTEHFLRLLPRFRPDLAVLACNTASVSCLAALRERFPALPFVGTVPAVKPAVEESRLHCIGVLGTERTVSDPYIDELAHHSDPGCRVCKIAAPELVEFVEYRCFQADPEERLRTAAAYVERFRNSGCDGIVLGCTHFLFLLEEFRAAAGAGMAVYDSADGVCSRIESLLGESRARMSGDGDASGLSGNVLLLTGSGAPETSWNDRAREYGMELRLFEGEFPLTEG
jgi:glutamate racemase